MGVVRIWRAVFGNGQVLRLVVHVRFDADVVFQR
jgi:mRNA-degrading endonuclease HigB of HigAB toxin-antitoxin module